MFLPTFWGRENEAAQSGGSGVQGKERKDFSVSQLPLRVLRLLVRVREMTVLGLVADGPGFPDKSQLVKGAL